MAVGEGLHQRLCFGWSYTLILFSISSIVQTGQPDSEIWGRPPIAHVNGGYEGIIIAIHTNVQQDSLDLNKTKEVIRRASRNLYEATGKFFKDVVILIPSSWNMDTHMISNEIKFATEQESYQRSHIRIRSSWSVVVNEDEDESSFYEYGDDDLFTTLENVEAAEPYVHQPGKCGEESGFISVTPEFIMSRDTSRWGNPEKALVHLWGHFRWGLFDEYDHSPFTCTNNPVPKDNQKDSRCSSGIENIYKKREVADGDSFSNITLNAVCWDSTALTKEVHTVFFKDITGSIMSVSDNGQINEFCHNSTNKNSSSKHNRNASNRQNRMCRGKSSWEVMEQHSDFHDKDKSNFEEPEFTLMIRKIKQKLVLMDNPGTITKQWCELLPNANDCYILQFLALCDSIGKIAILLNENQYFMMDFDFKTDPDVKNISDPNVEVSEILVLENTPDDLVRGVLNSTMQINQMEYTFLGDDSKHIPQCSQCRIHQLSCKYATVSEYLDTIHYDDVEEFVRILSEEGTINETIYSKEFEFTIDDSLDPEFTILHLRWNEGNLNISGPSMQPEYVSKTMIAMMINESLIEDGKNVSFTLKKTGPETVKFTLEVLSKASESSQDVEQVIVRPYVKSPSIILDCASAITIYTSVTRNEKPIIGANVMATVSSSDGSREEVVLQDSNDYEDFEDGIYSANFSAFNGSGNYTIAIKAKGEIGQAKWNVEGLQPSGILPIEVDVKKLLSKPFVLSETFHRAPRAISLEVHCQALSSTEAESTFLAETTSQTTERVTEGGLTTFLDKTTDEASTVVTPDETTMALETSCKTKTTTALSSTEAESTFLAETTSQTTKRVTERGLTTFLDKTTDEASTMLTPDETTMAIETSYETQATTALSSTEAESTFLAETTSQTKTRVTEGGLKTFLDKTTDEASTVPTPDETTMALETSYETQTTTVSSTEYSSKYTESTVLDGRTSRTTQRVTDEQSKQSSGTLSQTKTSRTALLTRISPTQPLNDPVSTTRINPSTRISTPIMKTHSISSTTTSSPTIKQEIICPDDKRWICIFVPIAVVTMLVFAISYLIQIMFSKREWRYSVENRQRDRV